MITADDWPIAASMLPFGDAGGTAVPRSERAARWGADLSEVADAGFADVDLTDSWLRYGQLDASEIDDLRRAARDAGVRYASMSLIRRSVIDEVDGADHLAYTHRCLDVAAELGVGVVSVGLHRALTPAQSAQLWFWTVSGHRDPLDDPAAWHLAVQRFAELGRHAADVGMLLSLEMYEHTFLGTAASAVRLVNDIGMDVVGLNPDLGNLIRLPEPIEQWREVAEATLPYANFWHVKNYTRDENAQRNLVTAVPSYLESGLLDYRSLVKTALAAGFQGVICTEHYGGDGLSMSAANSEYLRKRILPRREYRPGISRVRQMPIEGKRP
ncbi:sugar phosphate isomerase/epimerase family protein [Microbacterium sp. P05]|uniref:sugar phosphate isomerase/epimerase family protein n=1 Tax=Microbacterium sp. P05 TaxID=3366948 RepID=UPI0037468D53